jgi:hypothetical protein
MADEAALCLGCGGSMAPRPGISVCSLACRLRERRARRESAERSARVVGRFSFRVARTRNIAG